MHVHAIGDQPQGHPSAPAGFPKRARCPVVQARHGIEGVGEHRHPLIEPGAGLFGRGGAVAQGHADAQLPQSPDHRSGSLQFGGQGHQGNLRFEPTDPFLESLQAGAGQVFTGMGTAAGFGQKGALQMGPQQPATAGSVQVPRLPQHGQGLAQRRDAAGHQGRGDGFDPIAPQQLEELLQQGQIALAQLREGQPQPAVDL